MSGQDRWAAPLDGIVRRVLAADLASRMPGADVIAPGDPMPSGHALTVDVNLRQFIGDANGQVILDADWSVRGSAKTHPISLTRQAGSGKADAIAAAMSALLADRATILPRPWRRERHQPDTGSLAEKGAGETMNWSNISSTGSANRLQADEGAREILPDLAAIPGGRGAGAVSGRGDRSAARHKM